MRSALNSGAGPARWMLHQAPKRMLYLLNNLPRMAELFGQHSFPDPQLAGVGDLAWDTDRNI